MGKNLSDIKLSVGNNLKLNLEDKKIDKLLIAGNTVNFFGFLNNGELDDISLNEEDRNRYFWLLKRALEKTEIYVIGEVEEKEYYIELFNHFGQHGIRVNWKYIETFEPNDYLKIIDKIKNMKFDVCVMNPPYNRSLHLKFLERAINISDSVVSIQPIRWLQDPGAKFTKSSAYCKYENTISKHLENVEMIKAEDAKKYFDILGNDLAIYYATKKGGFNYSSISTNSIIENVINYLQENHCTLDSNKKDNYRIRIPLITGGKSVGSGKRPPLLSNIIGNKMLIFKDGLKDGKPWYEFYGKNQHSKTTDTITLSIKFDSEIEAINFFKSLQTKFGRYCEDFLITDVNISDKKILWMGNAIHPKTGKIGYLSEWTDEDFNVFFKLNKEEINEYNKYIDEYEDKFQKWNIMHNKKV